MYLVVGPQLAAVHSGGPHTDIFTWGIGLRLQLKNEPVFQLAMDCHLLCDLY